MWGWKNDVPVAALARQRVAGRKEIRLRDVATLSVAAARDNEQSVHLAIAAAIAIFLNRASRTGPFWVTNQGIMFLAPLSVATAIAGFMGGSFRRYRAASGS